MNFQSRWIKVVMLSLGSLGALASFTLEASAATPLPVSEQANKASVYYVGTRYYKTYFGWVVAKTPLALTIQVDPTTSQIHETCVGGILNEKGSLEMQKVSKTMLPVGGIGQTSNQFKIQFDGMQGSGLLQTSAPATLSTTLTTQEFLQNIEWRWNFEVGDQLNRVEGKGQFEAGALHITGTIRSHTGRHLIDYSDEYKEVSYAEFSNLNQSLMAEMAQ